MIHEVFMPALSSTMTEGKIVSWVKSPGEKVEKGETVVIVESDKADMDVESFSEGYLAAITVPAGETAAVGSPIALVVETEAEIEAAKQQVSAQTDQTETQAANETKKAQPVETPGGGSDQAQPQSTVDAAPAAELNGGEAGASRERSKNDGAPATRDRVIVSPRARKLAKDLKVDLSTLQGSGPHGRIVAEDVEAAVSKPKPEPAAPATPEPAPATKKELAPPVSAATVGNDQVVSLNTLQNAVVRNMVASLEVPTYRVGYTITTDNLDRLYKQIKPKGVTMTALLAKATALTLQKHPLLNASYVDQGIQHHSQINVAIAVAMEDGGLITPVLQNADLIDIYSLSRTWKDLVERSRAKKLQPPEYNSGTFTLSNLGMFGVDRFDAILSPGQGAILAIGAARPQVVATDSGLIGVQQQMQVNITCDHRVIYGTHAASFLRDLANLIETNPQSLTL